MTIEAKIEALTQALNANTAALAAAGIGKPTVQGGVKTPPPAQQAKADVKQTAQKSLSYDDVKTPFLAFAQNNRDGAIALLAPFGIDNLKKAKPEQYRDILAAVVKATAEAESVA